MRNKLILILIGIVLGLFFVFQDEAKVQKKINKVENGQHLTTLSKDTVGAVIKKAQNAEKIRKAKKESVELNVELAHVVDQT